MKRLAHISDLHIGLDKSRTKAAELLALSLLEAGVDHVICTGDVTEAGRHSDGWRFREAFLKLKSRMTVIPGNHDRGTDDYAGEITEGRTIWVEQAPGLYIVCVDSTTPENATKIHAHGELKGATIKQVARALRYVPPQTVPIVILHHHPMRLPGDGFADNVSDKLGLPFARELPNGHALLREIDGKCPLVLHGHRHTPKVLHMGQPPRIAIYNAGSTTELGRYRVFEHERGVLQKVSWQRFLF